MKQFAKIALISAAAMWGVSASQAATVTFGFDDPVAAPFTLDPDSPGIVNGNCATGSAPCLGVNKVGAAMLSIAAPLTFSVSSFWFQLLGKKDDLIVTTSNGTMTLLESLFPHNNGGQVTDVSALALFQNITFISFITNTGNARVDDIKVTYDDGDDGGEPAPVPLPAAGLLLAGALGGLSAFKRRKAA